MAAEKGVDRKDPARDLRTPDRTDGPRLGPLDPPGTGSHTLPIIRTRATPMPAKTEITRDDIMDMADYGKIRAERRREILPAKKLRRVPVGPYATFYFESYDSMWLQVHEMLFIEKGGEEQIEDELSAYNPLIPKGKELVATVMFEIDDPVRRKAGAGQAGRRRGDDDPRHRRRQGDRGAGSRRRPDHRRGQGEFGPVRPFPAERRPGRCVQDAGDPGWWWRSSIPTTSTWPASPTTAGRKLAKGISDRPGRPPSRRSVARRPLQRSGDKAWSGSTTENGNGPTSVTMTKSPQRRRVRASRTR